MKQDDKLIAAARLRIVQTDPVNLGVSMADCHRSYFQVATIRKINRKVRSQFRKSRSEVHFCDFLFRLKLCALCGANSVGARQCLVRHLQLGFLIGDFNFHSQQRSRESFALSVSHERECAATAEAFVQKKI